LHNRLRPPYARDLESQLRSRLLPDFRQSGSDPDGIVRTSPGLVGIREAPDLRLKTTLPTVGRLSLS
jgi:hypothetical protein